jgi:secondary thiamine-phosphate synthase enzyme
MDEVITLETKSPSEALVITPQVEAIVARAGIERGICHVMVLHSTAAIVVNETADPNIGFDVIDALERQIPIRSEWRHDRIDDNAHSHIKASLLGPSEVIRIRNGKLVLGRWQGIYCFEFDGPRTRSIAVGIAPDGVA